MSLEAFARNSYYQNVSILLQKKKMSQGKNETHKGKMKASNLQRNISALVKVEGQTTEGNIEIVQY